VLVAATLHTSILSSLLLDLAGALARFSLLLLHAFEQNFSNQKRRVKSRPIV